MTGDGTQTNPYIVASIADFAALDGKSGYVIMTEDIDFNSAGGKESFDGITIGGEMHFDGKGHIINNFYQEITNEHPNGGLFQGTFCGSIKNVSVLNAYILNTGNPASHYEAILISENVKNAVFENVEISGVINTFENYSCLAGFAPVVYIPENSEEGCIIKFKNCKATVNFFGGKYVGGYIAKKEEGGAGFSASFEDCVSACRCQGNENIFGGYVGYGRLGKFRFNRCISQIKCSNSLNLRNDIDGIAGLSGCDAIISNSAVIVELAQINSFDCFGSGMKAIIQSYVKGRVSGANYIHCNSSSYTEIMQSYIAIETDNCPYISTFSQNNAKKNKSFYDANLMPDTREGYGAASTEQLKSAEWLREQGWAI